jgi:transcription factor CRZ1
MELVYPAAVVPIPHGIPTEGPLSHPDGPPPRDSPYEQPSTQPSSTSIPPMPPQPPPHSPKLDAFFSAPELFNQPRQQPDPSSSTPAAEPSVAQGGAGANHYPSSSGVPRLPPILQVEKQQVTTSATQLASASRRRNEAHFVCPVPGCGSTFTRRFNLRGPSTLFIRCSSIISRLQVICDLTQKSVPMYVNGQVVKKDLLANMIASELMLPSTTS